LQIEGTENQSFHFAETFTIPAAVKRYTLINKGKSKARVIISFIKDSAC